ncbi:sigma-70 family RNA polymerase sigma factor [Candidatus Acetothermia bacterium]|nr:sigma-70 family RNA polymerase sigma factor [Candidatus Acetothermia bacterium]
MNEFEREDLILVRKIREGNQDAFEILYDRYANIIYSLAARMLGRETAEEIVQEVFVTLWCKANLFEPERGSFVTWLMRIAHYRAIDELRRRRRHKQTLLAEDADFPLEEIPDKVLSIDEQMQDEARRVAVTKALAAVSADQREVIDLAYFQGLTQSQIAAQLNIPLGTVKTRVRLGLQKLRVVLIQEGVVRV